MKILFIMLTTIVALNLNGCSLIELQQDSQALEQQLNQIQKWQARGKLSVSTPEDSVTGYLTWQQNNDQFDLFLSGPFGQGSSRLVGNDHSASLTLPGKDPVNAPSAESLMTHYLGWDFPVLDIRYWIKGQASPTSKHTEVRGSLGFLEQLHQHDWDVQLSKYQRVSETWLPGRIKITGHGFKFIFVIKEWTIDHG